MDNRNLDFHADPNRRVTRREYLETEYRFAGAVAMAMAGIPDPETARERRLLEKAREQAKARRDNLFCELRNSTNEKYGGTPDWVGDSASWTRHAVRNWFLTV